MLFQHPRYCASTEVAQLLYIPPGWSEMYSSGGPRRLMRTITIHLVLLECEFSFSEWVSVVLLTSLIAVDVVILLMLIFLLQFLFFFIELYSAHLIYAVAMFFDMPISLLYGSLIIWSKYICRQMLNLSPVSGLRPPQTGTGLRLPPDRNRTDI